MGLCCFLTWLAIGFMVDIIGYIYSSVRDLTESTFTWSVVLLPWQLPLGTQCPIP